MADKTLERLLEQAKADPKFFHALVFDPQSILDELEYVDRGIKGAIIALDPEQLIGDLIGSLADCGVTVNCTSTCTYTSSSAFGIDQIINPAINVRLGQILR